MNFVVYLTFYKGDKLPPFYIGSSTLAKINEGYLGSVRSKKWKDIFNYEIQHNRSLFKSIILSYHDSRHDALNEEYRLQIELNVVKSKLFFNEAVAAPNGFFGRDVSGKNNPFFGKTFSIESKNKMSIQIKDTMSNPEWKEKFSATQSFIQNLPHNRKRNSEKQKIAQLNEYVILKKSNKMNELFANVEFDANHKKSCQTEKFKNAQRNIRLGKKWVCNIKLNEQKYINPFDIDEFISNGWSIGMLKRSYKNKSIHHG